MPNTKVPVPEYGGAGEKRGASWLCQEIVPMTTGRDADLHPNETLSLLSPALARHVLCKSRRRVCIQQIFTKITQYTNTWETIVSKCEAWSLHPRCSS